MKYLLGEISNGARKMIDARARGWGRMFVDRKIDPYPGEPWALDNGAFRAWTNDGDYARRFARFERQLERAAELAARGRGPLFVVAPDAPADPGSIYVSLAWLREYEEERQEKLDPMGWHYGTRYGLLPVYLPVQNGMTPEALEELEDPETGEPVLAAFAGLFLGGDDGFKATAPAWRELADRWGMGLHFGRATKSRIGQAIDAGSTSADSSHPVRLGPDRWQAFLAAWDARAAQPELFAA